MWWMTPMLLRPPQPVEFRRGGRVLALQRLRARLRAQRSRSLQRYDLLDEVLAALEKAAQGAPSDGWTARAAETRQTAPAWAAMGAPGGGSLAQRLVELRRRRATQTLDSLLQLWGLAPSTAAQPGERAVMQQRNAAMADYDL
jgi:hypothetical protein